MRAISDLISVVRERLLGLPTWAKAILLLLAALFMYALPVLNPPIITTPDTDFGGVLFTVTTYVLVALGLPAVLAEGVSVRALLARGRVASDTG